MLRVGIDEAGYGPNLGPLVMTAVVAEGPDANPPDLWADLRSTVARAGSRDGRVWVDDSKSILAARDGRSRLAESCRALAFACSGRSPSTFGGLLEAFGAGTFDEVELSPWIEAGADPVWGPPDPLETRDPFSGAAWRVVGVRSVVVGPAWFNGRLDALGSKAAVHFEAFARLLEHAWNLAGEGSASVTSDKHGGRHYYANSLAGALPGATIEPGPEGPECSRYRISQGSRRLDLALRPRADADDGLVALASIASKSLREAWMASFNAHWTARVAGLRPTAGYPLDARRFRAAVEGGCLEMGLEPSDWWRAK